MKFPLRMSLAITMLLCLFLWVEKSPAAEAQPMMGQTVYVPVYSHIYYGEKYQPYNLSVTLSIRNTDVSHSITVTSVKYHDTDGKLIRDYQKDPIEVKPIASKDFFIKQSDLTGGTGASFIVKWKSNKKVNNPIIEAIMVGTAGTQGIAFGSRSQVIQESPK